MKSKIKDILLIFVGAILLSSGVAYSATWTGPTQPFPNGNVDAPINTSTVDQTKRGGFITNDILQVRLTSPGSAELRLYNAGGVAEWGIRQEGAGTHSLVIGKVVAGNRTDMVTIHPTSKELKSVGPIWSQHSLGTDGGFNSSSNRFNVDNAGSLRISAGSPASGKALVSKDASGNAEWGTPKGMMIGTFQKWFVEGSGEFIGCGNEWGVASCSIGSQGGCSSGTRNVIFAAQDITSNGSEAHVELHACISN